MRADDLLFRLQRDDEWLPLLSWLFDDECSIAIGCFADNVDALPNRDDRLGVVVAEDASAARSHAEREGERSEGDSRPATHRGFIAADDLVRMDRCAVGVDEDRPRRVFDMELRRAG